MPSGLGNSVFKAIISIPFLHRWINRRIISSYADDGPLPGPFTTKGPDKTTLWELLDKAYFALEVPQPTPDELAELPDMDAVMDLFRREGPDETSRVTLLLPFFAQHLTDAVFQSAGNYETDAPHEIILNQVYGNTARDCTILRTGKDGKLRSQMRPVNGGRAEFPDALMEQTGDTWRVRDHYAGLSYLKKDGKLDTLLEKYKGREFALCATGLFQGNMTLGNFAITTLLLREHNRLCDGIRAELERKGRPATDDAIFGTAQQCNTTAYMKVVIEDYINAFAGQKLFMLDTDSFFHEGKRWCRETPIPYHFNILYRIHCMIPDSLNGFEAQGFDAMLANNDLVFEQGVGAILAAASSQGASAVRLGNTHPGLIEADRGGVTKARAVLGSFNAHRRAQNETPADFSTFDARYRTQLKTLYKGNPDKVEYAVGILAELPSSGWLERLGLKDPPIIGDTLMNAIAKHAFRHILSNRFMTREYLNPDMMTDFGWTSLQATSSVMDLVRRNMTGEMDQTAANALRITFAHTA
ncbi:MAG: peroxidase family protein [Paracoccaceae bacterium]